MTSAKLFAVAVVALAPLLPAPAKAEPAPPDRVVLKPIKFIEYTLPNGLHVILHQNSASPVVSTYVLYHVGSKNERPDRTGFAHFFEHLMFEGTENIPRGKIDKYISGAGGNLNASTSFDQTDYFFNLPSNQLKLALWIESERMMHAKIDETGVETQRKVVKEEKRRSYDNRPYGSLFEELAKLVFKGTPYAWVPIGSAQYIDEAKIEEFRDFWKTYYIPNNATLVIAGDFDLEATKKLVAEYFGPIPRGKDIARPKIDLPPQTAPVTHDVLKPNTPLPATLHAWRAPKETDPDAYALELLGNILSSGRSSRLYKRLVEKEQAALDVQAFPLLLESAGMLGVHAVGQRGVTLEKLDTLIDEEVERVRKDGVTEEEYQKARLLCSYRGVISQHREQRELALVVEPSQCRARRQHACRQCLACALTAFSQNELADASISFIGHPRDKVESFKSIGQHGYIGRVAANRLRKHSHRRRVLESS